MARTTLLAAIWIATGCGGEQGPAQLEVEMLSVAGQVGGTDVPSASGATSSGEREGDQGTFFAEGPGLSMQLSACPLGNLENVDPYGVGGGGGFGPTPVPVADDAGVGEPSGLVSAVDCPGRGLTLCGAGACGQFTGEEVDLQIVEENGWRHVIADADGPSGSVQVSLRYRERH